MLGQSESFSKRRSYILPLLLLLCARGFCTSAAFVITPKQIVAGTDRLTTSPGPDGKFTKKGVATKIVLLKGRFIVVCVGLESLKLGATPDQQTVVYDFRPWIRAVESQIAADASVLQLAGILEKESARTFTETIPIELYMRNGTIKYSDSWKRFLVQYVVAGFDNGIATLVEINYEFDWDGNHLIGPTRNVQLPKGNINTGVYFAGQQRGLDQIENVNNYTYKRMSTLAPSAFKKILARQPTSPGEALRAVRAFISVEAEIDPGEVGAGATIVSLPIIGDGSVSEYNHALTLPKATQAHKKPQNAVTHN